MKRFLVFILCIYSLSGYNINLELTNAIKRSDTKSVIDILKLEKLTNESKKAYLDLAIEVLQSCESGKLSIIQEKSNELYNVICAFSVCGLTLFTIISGMISLTEPDLFVYPITSGALSLLILAQISKNLDYDIKIEDIYYCKAQDIVLLINSVEVSNNN